VERKDLRHDNGDLLVAWRVVVVPFVGLELRSDVVEEKAATVKTHEVAR